jgi:hypothetical protein
MNCGDPRPRSDDALVNRAPVFCIGGDQCSDTFEHLLPGGEPRLVPLCLQFGTSEGGHWNCIVPVHVRKSIRAVSWVTSDWVTRRFMVERPALLLLCKLRYGTATSKRFVEFWTRQPYFLGLVIRAGNRYAYP